MNKTEYVRPADAWVAIVSMKSAMVPLADDTSDDDNDVVVMITIRSLYPHSRPRRMQISTEVVTMHGTLYACDNTGHTL